MDKPFEICRPGTFVDARGKLVPVTEDALREMATGYNPKLRRAPLVIGHPKMDDPAFGWVSDLDYRDGALLARPEQVDRDFSTAVQAGRYANRSASFFGPNTPGNPTPGRYYLKHVGFLGARQPAVDGLKPVEFSVFDGEDDNGLVVSLAGWEANIRYRERRQVERETGLNRLVSDLSNKGVLRAGEQDAFVALAEYLAADSGVIRFGQGDDAEQADALGLLTRLFEHRPPVVMLGELNMGDNPFEGTELAMPSGIMSDVHHADLHRRAVAYQRSNGGTYQDAVKAVAGGSR